MRINLIIAGLVLMVISTLSKIFLKTNPKYLALYIILGLVGFILLMVGLFSSSSFTNIEKKEKN